MAWWVRVLQIKGEGGQPSGRYRLTRTSDEDVDDCGPFPLCDCENGHASQQEARDCPEAKRAAELL